MQGMILKRKLMTGLAVLAAAICLINCLIAAILYREMRERRDSGAVCEAARTAALCLDTAGLDIESYLNSLKGSPEVGNLYILTLGERELRCSQASGEAQKEIDSEQKAALETALAAFCSDDRLVIQHEGGRKSRTAAFVPLVGRDGRAVGLVMAEISMESVIRDTRRFCLYFLAGSIPVIALSCLLYFRLLSREIISPFDRLRRMTQEERECRLSAAAAREESGQDRGEMGQLTAAVEQMAEVCHVCRQQLDHLNRERERYEAEQRTRNVLQADLLAAVFPSTLTTQTAKLRAVRLPGKNGGDGFIDFFMKDETHIGITIAQMTAAKSLAAAQLLAVKIRMKDGLMSGLEPQELLDEISQRISHREECGFWTGSLELPTGLLTYGGSNGCFAYVMGGDGTFGPLDNRQHRCILRPSDTLFFCEGIENAMDVCQEPYGMERMINEVNFLKDKSLEELLDGVRKDISFFVMGADQNSDVSLMALRIENEIKQSPGSV